MTRLVAHRGFALEHAENTVGAVARAGRCASMVEVDVRRCASGDLAVVHDATVDRVTDGSGRVCDLTAGELGALDVLGSGEGVPTLDRVLAALPPGTGVNVELKERGLAADAAAAVRAADLDGDVLVSAFDPRALAELRAAAPGVPRALLFDEDPRANLDRAVALDCRAVHPHWTLLGRSLLLRRAHDRGLAVNAWTVESPRVGRALAAAGVDGVVADTPGVLPSARRPGTARD